MMKAVTLTIYRFLIIAVIVLSILLSEPVVSKYRARNIRSAQRRLAEINKPAYVGGKKHMRDRQLITSALFVIVQMLQTYDPGGDASFSVLMLSIVGVLVFGALLCHLDTDPQLLSKQRTQLERKLNTPLSAAD